MQNLTQPTLLLKPFAESGTRNSIPNVNSDPSNPQLADLTNGFPAITSESPDNGGLPPERADFNGLGHLTTTYDFFYQAGGTFTYNTTIATAIGGYPLGARLWYTDSNGNSTILKSTKANNADNFITTPSYIGTSWVVETPVLDWNNTWTGNNTFTGDNTFTATPVIHNSSPHITYKWSAISSQTTAPSTTTATDIIAIKAENNTNLAAVYHQRMASDNNSNLIFRQWNPSGASYYDMIYHVENAFSYLLLSHSPATGDNSNKVATTAWVRNHCCTTAATTTSTASLDAPAYVVQNYKNSDRWYRVWSDGWIEQGGIITSGVSVNSNGTQSLWKSFTDTNYTLQLTPGVNSTGAGFDTGTQGSVCYTIRTTSAFKWKITHISNQYYANTITWYACGY